MDSITAIRKIHCPCLIIHGLRDTLVPYQHAKHLQESCGKDNDTANDDISPGTECSLLLSNRMTHNEFEMERDLIWPMNNFLQGNDINWSIGQSNVMNSFVKKYEEAVKRDEQMDLMTSCVSSPYHKKGTGVKKRRQLSNALDEKKMLNLLCPKS